MVELWAKPQLLVEIKLPQCYREQFQTRTGYRRRERNTVLAITWILLPPPRAALARVRDVNTQREWINSRSALLLGTGQFPTNHVT